METYEETFTHQKIQSLRKKSVINIPKLSIGLRNER